jgi:hypothetical protein
MANINIDGDGKAAQVLANRTRGYGSGRRR